MEPQGYHRQLTAILSATSAPIIASYRDDEGKTVATLFRIGVNPSYVLEPAIRFTIDGVNIAPWLEFLANPGGICVCKTAFDFIESNYRSATSLLVSKRLK